MNAASTVITLHLEWGINRNILVLAWSFQLTTITISILPLFSQNVGADLP